MARRAGNRIWAQMFRRHMDSKRRGRFLVFTDTVRWQNAASTYCLYAHCIHIILRSHLVYE